MYGKTSPVATTAIPEVLQFKLMVEKEQAEVSSSSSMIMVDNNADDHQQAVKNGETTSKSWRRLNGTSNMIRKQLLVCLLLVTITLVALRLEGSLTRMVVVPLSRKSSSARNSNPWPVLPRTVFWDASPGENSNTQNNTSTSKVSSSLLLQYPMKIRVNLTSTDVTRYYPQLDSADGSMPGFSRRAWPKHPQSDDAHRNCVPIAPKWQSTFYPTCNDIHASAMRDTLVKENLKLLGRGDWRHAWRMVEEESSVNNNNGTLLSVWKTFRLDRGVQETDFEHTRIDAVAMERLTASPYVVNMYGLCGIDIVTEFAGRPMSTALERVAFKPLRRLEFAIQMAQGLADIHSIDGGRPSLVHHDINPANVLMTTDKKRLVFNDFNIAVLLMKSNETDKTCPLESRYSNSRWRSPEEMPDMPGYLHPRDLPEKVDIYALGNLLFYLVVRHAPWNTQTGGFDELQVARLKRINGTLPPVPSKVLNNKNPEIQTILQAMRECYRFNPKERPTAAQVVVMLRRNNGGDGPL